MEIKLPSTQINIYIHKRNGETSYVTLSNPTLKLENDEYMFSYINKSTGNDTVAKAIVIGNKFYMHSLTEPALSSGGEHNFFLYGHTVEIEDLHCDGETKVLLKLKYALKKVENPTYFTYES